jgi:hypothetical protein
LIWICTAVVTATAQCVCCWLHCGQTGCVWAVCGLLLPHCAMSFCEPSSSCNHSKIFRTISKECIFELQRFKKSVKMNRIMLLAVVAAFTHIVPIATCCSRAVHCSSSNPSVALVEPARVVPCQPACLTSAVALRNSAALVLLLSHHC